MALISTATRPNRNPAPAPIRNARSVGRRTSRARAKTANPATALPTTSSRKTGPSGTPVPRLGSLASRKATSAAAVSATAPSSRGSGHWREIADRTGTAKTMPVMMIGCTSAIGPLNSARAWKVKPSRPRAWPTTHQGRDSRCRSRLQAPLTLSGAEPATWCWTEVDRAVTKALHSAKSTASQVTS